MSDVVLDLPLVSIIINNYNYDRFLAQAIDSSLMQTYPHVEVIAIDDGSTDRSPEIIASYDSQLVSIVQANGGQAKALNTGIEISKGELIFFLDADDVFLPHKVAEMVEVFNRLTQTEPDIIISNHIDTIDERGEAIELNILDKLSAACGWDCLDEISEQNSKLIASDPIRLSTPERVYQFAAKYRFIPYLGMPTSGLAMTRSLAKKVFPIPCEEIKISADDFVVKAASLLGSVYLIERVLTKYRIHGKNNWYGSPKKIPEEFFDVLDRFLNSKLELVGKRPVFNYFCSTHAKGYYRTHLGFKCDTQLFKLAFDVISWHVNLKTIVFFLKTLLLATSYRFKRSIVGNV